MDKTTLLSTASELKQVSEKTAKEYKEKTESMLSLINTRMQERQDLDTLVGEKNISMMKDNHANHARFIASILHNYVPEKFVETVCWVFRAYRSHGFSLSYWSALLNTWIDVLKELMSEESFDEIYQYYEWMQVNIPIFIKLSDEQIEKSNK
jgi:hypothetical protein